MNDSPGSAWGIRTRSWVNIVSERAFDNLRSRHTDRFSLVSKASLSRLTDMVTLNCEKYDFPPMNTERKLVELKIFNPEDLEGKSPILNIPYLVKIVLVMDMKSVLQLDQFKKKPREDDRMQEWLKVDTDLLKRKFEKHMIAEAPVVEHDGGIAEQEEEDQGARDNIAGAAHDDGSVVDENDCVHGQVLVSTTGGEDKETIPVSMTTSGDEEAPTTVEKDGDTPEVADAGPAEP